MDIFQIAHCFSKDEYKDKNDILHTKHSFNTGNEHPSLDKVNIYIQGTAHYGLTRYWQEMVSMLPTLNITNVLYIFPLKITVQILSTYVTNNTNILLIKDTWYGVCLVLFFFFIMNNVISFSQVILAPRHHASYSPVYVMPSHISYYTKMR